ncbi:MAG TPA: response regulator, partial [Chthoniobacterales bacterium]
DLILLDVGLPTLNGIEAARRIRELSPTSRMIFVSQESSAEVVQEGFRAGALGYVFKTQAGVDLLAAVEAAGQGFRFISEGLAGLVPSELAGKQPTTRFHQDEVFAPARDVGTELPCRTVLPCRTYGLAGRTQRNPSVNRGTSIGLRFD